jgi:hypothetical protein
MPNYYNTSMRAKILVALGGFLQKHQQTMPTYFNTSEERANTKWHFGEYFQIHQRGMPIYYNTSQIVDFFKNTSKKGGHSPKHQLEIHTSLELQFQYQINSSSLPNAISIQWISPVTTTAFQTSYYQHHIPNFRSGLTPTHND